MINNKTQFEQCIKAKKLIKEDFTKAQLVTTLVFPGGNRSVTVTVEDKFISKILLGILIQFYFDKVPV